MKLACRIALAIFALVAAGCAGAAVSTAGRSPFAQGHWWEPARSGSGFDIFSANGNVGIVWFTYDAGGRPIWYTAVGALASMGAQPWPLMKHSWVGGKKQPPTQVGTLALTLRHPELLEVAWTVNGKSGTSAIEPLVFSGVVNEIDHSGHWFDAGNSGWGFSLQEQGDVLGGALFTYDLAGEPTWVSGYTRDGTSVEYSAFSGACPSCPYRAPTSSSAGRLTYEFAGEAAGIVHNGLSFAMAPGVNIDGASAVQLGRPASMRPADRQLASFASDAMLKAYLDDGMMNLRYPIYGGGGFSAPPPAPTLSPTNLQEAGVDEADLVKSDGRLIYTFQHDNAGVRKPVVRVARTNDEGQSVGVMGNVALASGASTPVANAGLFLHGNKLVSVTSSQASSYGLSTWMAPLGWLQGSTHVEVLDTSQSALPVTRWRAKLDGTLVSSRRIGQRLYVVSRFVPSIQNFAYGVTNEPAIAQNRLTLAQTPLSKLLPQVSIDGGAPDALVSTSSIFAPPQGARAPMADMILVTAIDLAVPRIAQSLAIVGATETVYASTSNLYVATSRSQSIDVNVALTPVEPPFYLTDIHQIRLADEAMSITGSASIEGFLDSNPDKASFRLSEHQGRLRAITSSVQLWGGTNRNRLTILEPSTVAAGLLRTIAYLPNKQRPETLGKPHELLYSTRFVGDRLYAVTFRVVDPLYVVDLANSTDPRIAGSLEVPGFSEYLHPLPNGALLGFGKDAKPAGTSGDGQGAWYQGLMLALYDVSDIAKPSEIQRVLVGKRGSDSALLRDHHAFSVLLQPDGTGTIAIPARVADGPAPQYGAGDSAFYPWQWSGLVRFALQGATVADTRLVRLPNFVTHRAVLYPGNFYNDPATGTARSILFRNGTIYVGNGEFWSQDAGGNVSGPH